MVLQSTACSKSIFQQDITANSEKLKGFIAWRNKDELQSNS